MFNAQIMHISVEEDGRISLWDNEHPELNTRSVKVIRLVDGDIALVPPVLSDAAVVQIADATKGE